MRWLHNTLLSAKVGANFADKQRSLGRSQGDYSPDLVGDRIRLVLWILEITNIMMCIGFTGFKTRHSCCQHGIENTVCPQSPLGVLKNCVLCSTLCIVERGINNSRQARRVDFVGIRTNDARIVSTHSSLTPGLPLLLRSRTPPVSRKRRCQSLGGCLLNCVR
jgi:hypothetical protein